MGSSEHRHRTQVVLYLVVASGIFAGSATAQHLYWSDVAGVHRAKADGTDGRILVADTEAHNLALDVGRGHIYWTIPGCEGWCDPVPGSILRANLDGTMLRTLVVDHEFVVEAFAIDPIAMRMYWGGPVLGDLIYDTSLSSANLDGSFAGRVLRSPHVLWPRAIAVDPLTQVLYWADDAVGASGVIKRAPVTNVSAYAPIVSAERGPYDLVVDADAGWLYWSEGGRFMRSGLDGSDAVVVVATDTGWRMALDPIAGKIYWIKGGSWGADEIRRVDLDGTGEEVVLSGSYIRGLAVDPRVYGDFDMDARVDVRDHARFTECLVGPGRSPALPACAFFDSDPGDTDVDLTDYARFQNAVTGPA